MTTPNAAPLKEALTKFTRAKTKLWQMIERKAFLARSLDTVDPDKPEMIEAASLQLAESALLPKHIERLEEEIPELARALNKENLELAGAIERRMNEEGEAFHRGRARAIEGLCPGDYQIGAQKVNWSLSTVLAFPAIPIVCAPWAELAALAPAAKRIHDAEHHDARLVRAAELLLATVKVFEDQGGKFVTAKPAIEILKAAWEKAGLS